MENKLLMYADDTASLRAAIARRLKAAGRSQNELCDATGVAASTMMRWDESAPNTSTLSRLEAQLAAWEKERTRAIRYSTSRSKKENPNALA